MLNWTNGTMGQPDVFVERRGFAPVDDAPYRATVNYDVGTGTHVWTAYSQRDANGSVRSVTGSEATSDKAKRAAARALKGL